MTTAGEYESLFKDDTEQDATVAKRIEEIALDRSAKKKEEIGGNRSRAVGKPKIKQRKSKLRIECWISQKGHKVRAINTRRQNNCSFVKVQNIWRWLTEAISEG